MLFLAVLAAVSFVAFFIYSSFFEWTLHRYLMHDDRFMKYPHRAHQLEHHDIFRADATYFLDPRFHDKSAEKHLTFAWWNAPLLIGLHTPLFALIYLGGYMLAGHAGGITASVSSFIAMSAYYLLYESVHYVMHVAGDRWIEKTKFFGFIQTHHRLHHVYYKKNLNVVIPIADFVLGTRVALPEPGFFDKLEEVRQRRASKAETSSARTAERPEPAGV